MVKRRTFIKLSALGALAGIVKPVSAHEFSPQSARRMNFVPKVISTWEHGMAANQAAWEVISTGGNALDAVEKGLRVTEADVTNRSVGIGGRPDASGRVTLDACIMDQDSRCGAVACLEGIDHPVSVARKVMEDTQHVMLVGEGAKKFALSKGFKKIKTPLKEVKKDFQKWKREQEEALAKKPIINVENHDTIGMLAMDLNGNICGACTTSGWAYKLPGRVGDSPIIGSGLFIDNEVGGAVATGLGEAIIRIAGSHTVVELMRNGNSPEEACRIAVERIISKHTDLEGLQCGFIAMDRYGNVGGYSVYNGFNFAYTDPKKHELIDTAFDRKW